MNRKPGGDGLPPAPCLRLHLAHGVSEHPERAVQFHVLVDAGDGAGGHGASAARASVQTAFRERFLRPVKNRPEVVAAILEAARDEQLAFGDRGGRIGVGRVVAQRECGAGKRVLFVAGERHGLHAVFLFADQVEAVQYVECAIDDVLHDIALVRHADLAHGFARNHAVLANEPVDAPQHLVAAGAIVRIEQDDLVDVFTGNLIRRAHANQVFCEFALVLIAHAGLADHEGLEAFVAQAAQHVDGGDVGVAFRATFVLAVREDGRGNATDLVVRQGRIGPEHRGAVMEGGSELHGNLHSKWVDGCCAERAPGFRPPRGLGSSRWNPGLAMLPPVS